MTLNVGEMRHVVRLESRSTVQDGSGDPLLTWIFFTQCRASIERTPGRELWTSSERQGRVPTVFRVRYLPGVVPAMRLIHRRDDVDRVFNIISAIDPDGLRVEMVITAEELVGEPA